MTPWMILLTIAALVIALFCTYLASSLNKKLNRMRKRYDYLLRGRGDVSMEELIAGFGEDLDSFKNDQKQTAQRLHHIEQWMAQTDTDQQAYINERFDTVAHDWQEQMRSTSQNLVSSMKRLDEQVFARLDAVEKNTAQSISENRTELQGGLREITNTLGRKVKKNEEDTFIRFDEMEKRIELNNKESKESVEKVQNYSQSGLQSLDSRVNEQFHLTSTEFRNQLQSMQQKTEDTIKSLEKQTLDQLATIDDRAKEALHKEGARIREQFSFAIQKTYLYRYNAFEDVVGNTSFSLVLLDEHNSGIIFTSLYSRRGSTTFAKEVRNGEAGNLSPEENYALDQILHGKSA